MSKKTTKEKNCRLGAVGGQAVLEGVMMRHGTKCSVAVRRENGVITVSDSEYVSLRKKHKLCNIPIIRGVINMVESLVLSYRTLEVSAKQYGLEDEEPPKEKKKNKKKDSSAMPENGAQLPQESAAPVDKKDSRDQKESQGKSEDDKLFDILMPVSMLLGIAFSIGLFILLPTFLANLLDVYLLQAVFEKSLGWWRNPVEGVIKIAIFIAYLSLISLMKDIRRTFEYHGAEHKTIFCYEAGEELTPENVKKHKRLHPRCGTSFMFVIILISIAVSSFIPKELEALYRSLLKIATLPITVGLGFEFIMLAGKHDNIFTRILSAPGLLMQKITTKEPDEAQIEVAIHALKASMPEQFPDFIPELRIDGDKEISREEALAARGSDNGENNADCVSGSSEAEAADSESAVTDSAPAEGSDSDSAVTDSAPAEGSDSEL